MLNVLLQEWARNNPEQARAVNSIVEGFFIALTEAGRKLYPILEVLVPEVAAARLKKRYEETGIAIQIDEATRLAFLIMALRIPYTGPDPRPDGIIGSHSQRSSRIQKPTPLLTARYRKNCAILEIQERFRASFANGHMT